VKELALEELTLTRFTPDDRLPNVSECSPEWLHWMTSIPRSGVGLRRLLIHDSPRQKQEEICGLASGVEREVGLLPMQPADSSSDVASSDGGRTTSYRPIGRVALQTTGLPDEGTVILKLM
jgi:hypothetical protein